MSVTLETRDFTGIKVLISFSPGYEDEDFEYSLIQLNIMKYKVTEIEN